jgi:putative aldouronate transport system permease protein
MLETTPAGPAASTAADPTARKGNRLVRRFWRDRWMYALMLPGLLYYAVFQYLPLLGNVVAFQDYSPFRGFRGSPWVGLENFARLVEDPDFGTALRNTLVISLLQLIFFFPAPIVLALVLNGIMSESAKRFVQSVVYLPHFLSWVIIIALWQQIVGGDGLVNHFLRDQGRETLNVMANPDLFKPLVVLQLIWKETGWGTIIFLAALTKIDPTLYEAAVVDGAGPRRRLWDITLPGISGVIVLLLVIRLGYTLSTGFEQMLLQRDAVGADAGEVLDTFVYFRGIRSGDWGLATAVDLVKGVVGMALVLGANRLAKRVSGEGVF